MLVEDGINMSTPQMTREQATQNSTPATVDLKLEVVVLPVSDVDRAKRFYERLGWRLDADLRGAGDWRGVQFTPPGSPCSIHFGVGITTAAPGSFKNLYLVVSDIEAARADLIGRGVEVSETFHFTGFGGSPVPGRAPNGGSYASFATFSDPDGNSWLIQEITTRFPGRGLSNLDLPSLTALLREAEQAHGAYEASAPTHHWSDFYAAYIVARENGKVSEDAVLDGVMNVERVNQRPGPS
jgi:catechol 2,3-dioxygenase-like lactoylglutathione lyase family enzyme